MLSKRGEGGSLHDGPLSREQDIVPVWRVRRVNLGAEKRGGGGGGGYGVHLIKGHFLEVD